MKLFLSIIASFSVVIGAVAQYDLKLAVATAIVSGKPEVRIRWQFREGWFPAGGLRLYSTNGNTGRLVKFILPPSDTNMAAHFGSTLSVSKLAIARTNLPAGTKLNLAPVRPPSGKSEFTTRQTAIQQLKSQPNPILTGIKPRTVQAPQSPLLRQVGVLAAPVQFKPLSSEKLALSARGELHFAALLQNTNSAVLGLGATDSNLGNGDTVSYALYAVDANGQNGATPLASLTGFVVGSDPQPLAPTNIISLQDEDEISLRWDRVPVALESNLLAASYRISRAAPQTVLTNLTPDKPLVILNLETPEGTNTEPDSFFSDTISRADTYTYRVTLVDGFGRQSQPGVLTVTAEDWRRPRKPFMARATLGSDYSASLKGVAFGKIPADTRFQPANLGGGLLTRGVLQPKPKPPIRPTVAWRYATNALGEMPVKFNIYRIDLDETNPAVKLTATPIDGDLFPITNDAQWEQARDLLFGTDADELNEIRISQKIQQLIEEGKLSNTDTNAVAMRRAIERAKYHGRLKIHRNMLEAGRERLLVYEDKTTQKDRKYSYLVTAVNLANGLECEPVEAGSIGVPDFAKPPPVTGILATKITINPPTDKPPVLLAANKNLLPFRAGEIQKRKVEQKAATARAILGGAQSPALRGVGPGRTLTIASPPQFIADYKALRFPIKLNIPEPDYGARVELAWNPVPNMRGVVYQVRRSYGGETNDVGLTTTNKITFVDKVPRSPKRDYEYHVVALSRWGIFGSPSIQKIIVDSSVKPETPNLLFAAPGDSDGEIKITIDPASPDESVTSYAIYRNNVEIKMAANSGNPVVYLDKDRLPGQTYKYKVKAITAAKDESIDFSQELVAKSVKTIAAAPTLLSGTPGPKGVTLTWTAAPAITASYIVRRKPASATATTPATILAPKVTTNTFLDVFAMSGKTYIYEVLAVDAQNNVSPPASTNVTVTASQ